jgi:hypothetical protein
VVLAGKSPDKLDESLARKTRNPCSPLEVSVHFQVIPLVVRDEWLTPTGTARISFLA